MNENRIFLTVKDQELLLFLYPNYECTFNSQPIFKNKQWFVRTMKRLDKFDAVSSKKENNNSDLRVKKTWYKLTFIGKLVVEKFILDYNKANGFDHEKN